MKYKINELFIKFKKNKYEYGFLNSLTILLLNIFNKKGFVDYKLKLLKKEYHNTLEKFNNCNISVKHNSKKVPIWVCWWQGYNNMPDLCKACFNSLKRNMPPNANIILITEENVNEYLDIPLEISNKLKTKELTITFFTDWLRNELLMNYGGFWIDSTMYVSKKISESFIQDNKFWSVKQNLENEKNDIGLLISKRQWGGYILKSGPHSLINTYLCDVLTDHIINHKYQIDYFAQNLLLRLAYNENDKIKNDIDSIPFNNSNIYLLDKLMNDKFEENTWNRMIEDTTFFKLSWKKEYKKYTSDGDLTYYGYLLKNNN